MIPSNGTIISSKLSHGDIGQMDMSVRIFDALKRGEDDNPTIGIILCAQKDEIIVKYSVLK
ncbi:PDDEXK nuclease domain-containing protein [Sphingobacterium sp. UDSM-2020]|uniref:PDDEXK nuclease domain-containing protein n=1 Tax=Sphingobacterium sp. UDSM-2020 TaxID=2795738 RepID=UPI0039792CC5